MELSQSIFLKGKRFVRLLPDDTLRVEVRSDGAISEFSVALRHLDDSPIRIKQPPSKFVLGAVVCSFLFLGTFAAWPFVSDQAGRIVLGFLSFLLVLPLGFSFYRLWRHTYDVTAFRDRESGQPVFNLFTDEPSHEEFQRFVTTLQKRIGASREFSPGASTAADQLQSFARLKEQGILTHEEFATIKKRLLDSVGEERGASGSIITTGPTP
jgi:hypothetical protein